MTDKAWRNEIKYVCTQSELLRIEHSIRNLCSLDRHAGPHGEYQIRSLYFDDYRNSCMWENENGVDPREKFRIRIYNGSADRITLECKQKASNMTHKDACLIDKNNCEKLMHGGRLFPVPEETSLFNRFAVQMTCRMLMPKIIVQYTRTAYVYPSGNVRITFDRNISGSQKFSDFLQPYLTVRPVMPNGYHILEVKYDEFLPDFIYNALQVADFRQTAYSKYYVSRMHQALRC